MIVLFPTPLQLLVSNRILLTYPTAIVAMVYGIMLLGDSSLFHESPSSSWLSCIFSEMISIASFIKNIFPSRGRRQVPDHPLHTYVQRPVLYPLYSFHIGHSDATRLQSAKELMDQLNDDSILVIWTGQHDTWKFASTMNLQPEQTFRKLRSSIESMADHINDLDFELVIVVSFFDHSNYKSIPMYNQLNEAATEHMLEVIHRSKLLDIGQFDDDQFQDLTHLKVQHKHSAASRLLDGIMQIIDVHRS